MLILSIIFTYVISLSLAINVWISQCKHYGTTPRYTQIQTQQAFLIPLNLFKCLNLLKIKKDSNSQYDQSQITKTINLPKNIWPSIPEVNEAGIERQDRIQKYWEEENVYHKLCENRFVELLDEKGKYSRVMRDLKIIYDGPPYANGRPHFGHFLNKTIKDVFIRFFLLQGDVPIMIPGWDCHGMPIEHKILKMYNSDDDLSKCNNRMMEQYDCKEELEPKHAQKADPADEDELAKYDNHPILTPYGVRQMMLREKLEREEEEREELKRKAQIMEQDEPVELSDAKRWSIFVRDKCKEFAYRSIKTQMNYFKKSGIWAFWGDYYATYHSVFEKSVIDTFMELKQKGHIYQAKLPQLFSSKSKSVLADSEILHRNEKVLTTYISFKVDLESCHSGILKRLRDKMAELGIKNLKLVVLTTTGYTIPGNKGLAVNRKGRYHLYQKGDSLFIMNDFILKCPNDEFWSTFKHVGSLDMLGKDPQPSLNASGDGASASLNDGKASQDITADAADGALFAGRNPNYFVDGYVLQGLEYFDPVYGNKYKVYADNFVEIGKGTGIVHLSPAHGFDDFNCISRDASLCESTSNDEGHFCNLFDEDENYYEHIHADLRGVNIRDFDEQTLQRLIKDELLRYEYREMEVDIDWRCENRVHTRLTNQYCLALPPREYILDVVKMINITPKAGEKYLRSIISARNRDWCLSRQRFWGTPIPFVRNECLIETTITDDTIAERLWSRSKDILNIVDVWFESALVRNFTLKVADLVINRMLYNKARSTNVTFTKMLERAPKYVIEGQDQHRGWFQSLIIVNMLLNRNAAPFDNLFSHLFVTVNGQKLSKSKMSSELDAGEQGTRQLVRVDKDEDMTNRMRYEPIEIRTKIDEELSRFKHTLTPGYDICKLLNPRHPKLTGADAAGDGAEAAAETTHFAPESDDEYNQLFGNEFSTSDDEYGAEQLDPEAASVDGVEADTGQKSAADTDKLPDGKRNRSNVSNTYFNIDVLRTLACNNDFLTHDLDLSKDSLRSSKQTHKKIVNCFKYITGVLAASRSATQSGSRGSNQLVSDDAKNASNAHKGGSDESARRESIRIPEKDDDRYEFYQLNALDAYFLNLAYSLAGHCKDAYENAQFYRVLGLVERFITSLSSLYFCYIKNFIYILPPKHPSNRAIRFVLNKLLYILLKVLAPIMPHMCEDLYRTINPGALSLFAERWPMRPEMLVPINSEIGLALTIRKLINKDNSNYSSCVLRLEENSLTSSLKKLEKLGVDLRLIFNVAAVKFYKKLFNSSQSGSIKYTLKESGYKKCKRCWLYREDVQNHGLCKQCKDIMEAQK